MTTARMNTSKRSSRQKTGGRKKRTDEIPTDGVEIWYKIEGRGARSAARIQGFTGTFVYDLMEVILQKSRLDDSAETLQPYAKRGSEEISLSELEENLGQTLNFKNIISEYSINKWNPIIVRLPAMKKDISIAFPEGLSYVQPKSLLYSSGMEWEYQPGSLFEDLSSALRLHYKAYCDGYRDKINMPIYLFLSGAGTGKSRNASELHQTAINCLQDPTDSELKNRLMNAWVFNVSLENGLSLTQEETVPFRAIGNRMLLQLLPDKNLKDIIDNYDAPDPLTVLELVAKHENRQLKDATIIVTVDGMQNIMDSQYDGNDPNSRFYITLSNIGDLSMKGIFLISCCTATIAGPVVETLRPSNRLRKVLPVTPLEPPTIDGNPVFDMNDPLKKLLVSDCGGHGRALEILSDVMQEYNLTNYNVGNLMRELHRRLAERYSAALELTDIEAKAIVQAILSHHRFSRYQRLPGITKSPDQVVSPGLIVYNKKTKRLTAPYIWIWMLAEDGNGGSLVPEFQFDHYAEIISKEDKTLPMGFLSWQNFEHFNCYFRCLKSRMLNEGQFTRISDIHSGARLNGDISFRNHHLQLAAASLQTDTRTYTGQEGNIIKWIVQCEDSSVNVRECKNCIINQTSASYGDSFLGLEARCPCNEVHQCKFYTSTTLSQQNYNDERDKAASLQDFFILFTTGDAQNIILPPKSGIVDKTRWEDYYGPFAGRAYFYSLEGPPDINHATRSVLQMVDGLGPVYADRIIEKRPYNSIEHACKNISVPENILKKCKCST